MQQYISLIFYMTTVIEKIISKRPLSPKNLPRIPVSSLAILGSSRDRKLRRRQFETYFNIHMERWRDI